MATFVNFQGVQLDPSMARECKRLTIHLGERGIAFRPVNRYSGLRPLALLKRMRDSRNWQEFGFWGPGASSLVSLESPHRYGLALDGSIRIANPKLYKAKVPTAWRARIDGGQDANAFWDYVEHVIKHYKLNLDRPLYPQVGAERNHITLTSKAGVKPLSPNALVRYARALKV